MANKLKKFFSVDSRLRWLKCSKPLFQRLGPSYFIRVVVWFGWVLKYIRTLVMETQLVSQMLVCLNQLTLLSSPEKCNWKSYFEWPAKCLKDVRSPQVTAMKVWWLYRTAQGIEIGVWCSSAVGMAEQDGTSVGKICFIFLSSFIKSYDVNPN